MIPKAAPLESRSSLRGFYSDLLARFNRAGPMALLVVAYFWLLQFVYVQVIGSNQDFVQAGFEYYRPLPLSQVLAAAAAVIPLLWIRLNFRAVSDVLILHIFLFVFIPSMVYITIGAPASLSRQVGIEATLIGAMLMIEVRRVIPPLTQIRAPSTTNFYTAALLGVAGLAMLAMWSSDQVSVENLDLTNVYERRSELVNSGDAILGYIANWSSFALAPLCLIFGGTRRNWLLVAAGIALAVMSFALTSFRSNLFLPLFGAAVAFFIRYSGMRATGLAMTIVALTLTLAPLALDTLLGASGFYTWLVHFRFIGNNGFLTAQYFLVFEHAPKGLYQDTFGRFLFHPVYPRPIAELVGSSFSMEENHANGNFWADGYGNLGLAGVAFASLSAAVLCWLLDSLAAGKNLTIGIGVTVVLGFGVANTAVHSVMTSNGGILVLALLFLLPVGGLARIGSGRR